MATQVLNTDANLVGKTLMAAENADTVTGLKTFDRDPSAPFAVSSGSAVVPNLDADKVDGIEGANIARWDGLGTPGGKIAFPAVQVPSADPNTLDDYEEGSWTPAFVGSGGQSGQVYSVQVGRYVKIGRYVHAQGRIALSTLGTLTGTVRLSGLPFAPDTTADNVSSFNVGIFGQLTTAVVFLGGFVDPSTGTIPLQRTTAAATGTTSVVQADLSNTTTIYFSVNYIAGS